MNTIQSEQRKHGIKTRHKKSKNKSKKLSQKDLKDLMGTHRPTYSRHRGAYRQR